MMHAPAWTVGQDSSPPLTGRHKELVPGAGSGTAATGLTVREERYKRELEGLRTRVRELEGMMEGRLEERERAYHRKLRAAVAECRSLKVCVCRGGVTLGIDAVLGDDDFRAREGSYETWKVTYCSSQTCVSWERCFD